MAAWASLDNFGPLLGFGPLWAILGHYGVPILGFRFGYDQVDCVAPVFKKELT